MITVVPCLSDNYAYLVTVGARIAVVDPSEAEPVLHALAGRKLHEVWATHHHHDHVGGIAALKAHFKGLRVRASTVDAAHIPEVDTPTDADFSFGAQDVSVLAVPGHTLGANVYVIAGAAFTGDTLFSAGCGRLFEGTAEQLWTSLRRIAALPADTRLYCGHEYYLANLRFAAHHGCAVGTQIDAALAARAAGLPTVPTTVAEELRTNVFVRAADAQAFAVLRTDKDSFR